MSPPSIEVSLGELKLAWKRTKADHDTLRFVDHPHLTHWVEHDLDGWLTELQSELASGYSPKPSQMCWALKPDGQVRPGSVLNIRDEVVFNILVARVLPALHAKVVDLRGAPDVSYQLAEDPKDAAWIATGFELWNQWRQRSLDMLSSETSYVVVADIAGFYDNIDIRRLASDVRQIHNAPKELHLLVDCLSMWAYPRGRGIPQGYSASHLLAKLFLEPVDRSLVNDGYSHLRYVDDFRIFLPSNLAARRALVRLTELLHRRGLSLQSAKTRTIKMKDALTEFDRVSAIIRAIRKALVLELADDYGIDLDYVPTWQLDALLESSEGPPPEVLELAFGERFGPLSAEPFDKTVFRYLLNNLGKASSRVAAGDCPRFLRSNPEETAAILRYLSKVGVTAEDTASIEEYLQTDVASLYDYQLYEILRWFYSEGLESPILTSQCRKWAFDNNRPLYLRSYAIAYLGLHGDAGDFENLEHYIVRVDSSVERADIAAAIARMEVSRRNAAYGRLAALGGLPARAVALSKSKT